MIPADGANGAGLFWSQLNNGSFLRQALDRAFRRGWEAFIANLYSVTLTPVTAPSPSPKEKQDHGAAFAKFQVTNLQL